jgi:hypothetical protein
MSTALVIALVVLAAVLLVAIATSLVRRRSGPASRGGGRSRRRRRGQFDDAMYERSERRQYPSSRGDAYGEAEAWSQAEPVYAEEAPSPPSDAQGEVSPEAEAERAYAEEAPSPPSDAQGEVSPEAEAEPVYAEEAPSPPSDAQGEVSPEAEAERAYAEEAPSPPSAGHAWSPAEPAYAREPPPPPSPPPSDPPRSAYARLEAPEVVPAGREFDLVVGLASAPEEDVAGEPLVRPASSVGDYDLVIQVVADGFTLRSDESWRNQVRVTVAEPYPALTVHLTASAQDAPVLSRAIKATYSTGGQTMGFAVRPIAIVRDPSLLHAAEPVAPEPAHDMAITTEIEAPDLTIQIHRGVRERAGRLLWTFQSPHPVTLPEGEPDCDIGDEPERYLKRILEGVAQRENEEDLYAYLKGRGREIGDKVPVEVWELLAGVAAHAAPRPPTVLLLSEEPYVPWELAVLEDPIDPLAPPFLAAQTVMGRWVLAPRMPPPNPPDLAEIERLAVVWGRYDSATWKRLEGAEREAATLTNTYEATPVDATKPPVMACLHGTPAAELLHFSMHGQWEQSGLQDGLILTDGKVIDPAVVKGIDLDLHPFVFLNACQVGAGQSLLGDYAGMAEAFLRSGACAVVAPLWAIDDEIARGVAVRFYEEVFAGRSPADVLRRERREFVESKEPMSSTSLAYQFFGHPTMRLRRRTT